MGQEELNEHLKELVESMVERSECEDCEKMDCECKESDFISGMRKMAELLPKKNQTITKLFDVSRYDLETDATENIEEIQDDIQELKKWLEMETETNALFRREVLAFLRKHYKGEDLSDLCSRFGE